MEIRVYRVTDSHGNVFEGAVNEPADTLHVWGLKRKSGASETFESEAYHLGTWADDFGFEVREFRIELDLDKGTARFHKE